MKKNVHTSRESIQGQWNEKLWYQGPEHELENKEAMPKYMYDSEQFLVKKKDKLITK